jgi:hypothetical protein
MKKLQEKEMKTSIDYEQAVGDTVLFSISFSMSLLDLFFCSSFFLSLDLVIVNHKDPYYVCERDGS